MIVTTPPATAALSATVESDGWTPLDYAWTVESGAGVTIDDPAAPTTTATFPAVGTYLLAFTASAPESGTFLADEDGAVLTTDDDWLLAVEGAGDPGFSDAVSATALVPVTVVPETAAPIVRTEAIGRDLHILIAGVEYAEGRLDLTKGALLDAIAETADDTANTASLTVRGFYPLEGQQVEIRLDTDLIFAGRIIRGDAAFDELWANRSDHVGVVDWTWDLKRRRITRAFVDAPLSSVAAAIVARAPGFTFGGVQGGGSGTVTIDLNGDLPAALTALCATVPGLAWTVDYTRVVRLTFHDVSATPEPITYAHPSVAGFHRQGELGDWVTQLRVFGAATASTAASAAGSGTVLIASDSVADFGTSGGQILLEGMAELVDRKAGEAPPPASLETAFAGVATQPADLVAGLPGGIDALISDEADIATAKAAAPCLSEDEILRHYLVKIRVRPIRVTATDDARGLDTATPGARVIGSGRAVFTYYATYVTNRGESKWMQQMFVGIGGTGLFLSPWGSTGVGQPKEVVYNGAEFVCDAIPPTLQRINIYRQTVDLEFGSPAPDMDKGCKLVGSLTAKGKLGTLGDKVGEENKDRAPGQPPVDAGDAAPGGTGKVILYYPVNLGEVVDPSSNTLVDAGEPVADERTLPTKDIPLPDCPPDPEATPDPDAAPKTPPETIAWLQAVGSSITLPKGTKIRRFKDVVDSAAQALLAARLEDDGVVEGPSISGEYTSDSAMEAAGRAAIARQNRALLGVNWTSRDGRTHPLRIIGVYVPPHVTGEFVIKTVTITEFQKVGCANGMKSYPLYSATAEPRYASIVNRLT